MNCYSWINAFMLTFSNIQKHSYAQIANNTCGICKIMIVYDIMIFCYYLRVIYCPNMICKVILILNNVPRIRWPWRKASES